MPLDDDITAILHDEAPDETLGRRLGKLVQEEVGEALARAVIRPYSSPFYEARSVVLGAGGQALQLLPYHAGRVRALISVTAGAAVIGPLSQVASGNGYVLGASPVETKATDEIYVITTGGAGATVSVWAEYAVN